MWHNPYNDTNYEFGFADIEAPDNKPTLAPTVTALNHGAFLDLVGVLATNMTIAVHAVKVWWRNGSSIGFSA